MTKAQSEAVHFRRRLLQRYGITINHRIYHDLCRDAVVAPLILKRTERSRVVLLMISGSLVPCVYDRVRMRLVTALPPSHLPDWKGLEDRAS
jgi:hypothetical protein